MKFDKFNCRLGEKDIGNEGEGLMLTVERVQTSHFNPLTYFEDNSRHTCSSTLVCIP